MGRVETQVSFRYGVDMVEEDVNLTEALLTFKCLTQQRARAC